MRQIKLGNRIIDQKNEPYIIAEIGVNHEQSKVLAKKLIELAHEGGASAAKFQSYKADTLAAKTSPSYWDLTKEKTASQYELFKRYDSFNRQDYFELKEHCDKIGIDFISTPFDDESLEYLVPLVPFLKIASADLTNTPFLRKAARTKKPIVLSTGASNLDEINLAVKVLVENGCEELALLHCILNYPTPIEFANINMIEDLMQKYSNLVIGYSDHTPPDDKMWALTIAYVKGARIIEKHFTHDKTLPGNDHYHAMTCDDLKIFVDQVKASQPFLGSEIKAAIPSEAIARQNARRSIVTKGRISAGCIFTEKNMTYKRPGSGVSPIYWDDVIGSIAANDLEDDHILQWSDIVQRSIAIGS